MDTITALFNVVLIIFIVATMLSAGFNTTFEQLQTVFRKWQLVAMVAVVGFVIRPHVMRNGVKANLLEHGARQVNG